MSDQAVAYLFGGTMDPFHQGHLGVVREIRGPNRMVVIAPTEQNPWKQAQPTPLALRCTMIRHVLEAEGITPLDTPSDVIGDAGAVYISSFSYTYAVDLIRHWRSFWSGALRWVVGPDIDDAHVAAWKDWATEGIPLYRAKTHAANLRATDIRGGDKELHPAIRSFAKSHGLYGLNPSK